MFGLGIPEIAVISIIALVIFGPKRLPEVARSIGKAVNTFNQASRSITNEIKEAADDIDVSGKKNKEDTAKS